MNLLYLIKHAFQTVQTKLKVIEHQFFLLGVEDIQDKIEDLIDSGPWMESILNVYNHRGLICFAWMLGIFLSIKLYMYEVLRWEVPFKTVNIF